jgi:sec-independent protein translocase protein TatA
VGELFAPTHLVVIAIVAVLLFGSKKLPGLGRGIGEGLREFKDGIKGIASELNETTDEAKSAAPKAER